LKDKLNIFLKSIARERKLLIRLGGMLS